MTKIEIIDFIAGYYKNSNRSFRVNKEEISQQQTCLYTDEKGNHCAFGLMMINPPNFFDSTNSHGCGSLLDDGGTILKPEFRGHGVDFYIEIQKLHDSKFNWNDEGLSEIGKEAVVKLKERYAK